MIDWDYLADRVTEKLTPASYTLLGTSLGVDPKLAATVATSVIRDEVESYIATIPRVPRVPPTTNDVLIATGGFALAGLFFFGIYKILQADMKESK